MTIAVAPIRDGVRFVGLSSRILERLSSRIGAADEVLAEAFQLGRSNVTDALAARARSGGLVSVLTNPRQFDGQWGSAGTLAGELSESGARLTQYGAGSPISSYLWNHSKVYHFTGPTSSETWLTNTPLGRDVAYDDVAVVLHGHAADAARAVTRALLDPSRAGLTAAVDDAARAGVLVNEPLVARWPIAEAMRRMVGSAQERLVISVKELDSPEVSRMIAATSRRGVHTEVRVRDIAAMDHRILSEAGIVPTKLNAWNPRMHLNAIESDGQVLISSAYPWQPMLGGDARLGMAHDWGVLLEGRAATDARREVAALIARSTASPRP